MPLLTIFASVTVTDVDFSMDLPPLATLPAFCCCCFVLRSGLLGGAACFLYCPVYLVLDVAAAAFLFTLVEDVIT